MKGKPRVAAIIPAFNEEKTVAEVVEAAKDCLLVSEVIVVDDGSADDTARRAEAAGAKVVRLPENKGKGRAMQAGSQATRADWLLFLDADLLGLTPDHLEKMIIPIWREGCQMSVGTIDRRARWGSLFMRFFRRSRLPLAGTRVVSRRFWETIPAEYKQKFYVESAISYLAKERSLKVKTVLLDGVSHLVKEKKRGLVLGLAQRSRMLGQILWINIFLRFF